MNPTKKPQLTNIRNEGPTMGLNDSSELWLLAVLVFGHDAYFTAQQRLGDGFSARRRGQELLRHLGHFGWSLLAQSVCSTHQVLVHLV